MTADVNTNEQHFKEKLVIPLWSLMVWIVLMNTSMFNIVIPTVISDLNITASQGSWFVTGYSLFLAISTVTMSRLSDYIPIKTLLLVGMLLFGLSSIVAFFTKDFIILMICRFIQASGAGASQALGIVLAARYVPLTRRGKAMSLISLAASLAFGLGPIVGGLIAHAFNWSYLFIFACLVLLFIPFLYKHLPDEPKREITFDFIGAFLIAVAATVLLLFITTLQLIYLGASIVSILLVVLHLRRNENPFIQPELMRQRAYLKIVSVGFIAFATNFATLFVLPLLLAEVFQMESLLIGFIIFPGAFVSALSAIVVGRVIDRFGNNFTMSFGLALLTVSSLLFGVMPTLTPTSIMITFTVLSVGFFTLTSSLSNELTRILPPTLIGSGLGLQQLTTLFGIGFGVAIAGLFISEQAHLEPMVKYKSTFLVYTGLTLLAACFLAHYLYKKSKATRQPEKTEEKVQA